MTWVALASTRARSRAKDGVREDMKERWRSKNKRSSLILCDSNAIKWDILQMVAPQWRKDQVKERRREAQACQVLQVPHMGSPHLYVPNQAIGEATRRASIKATSRAREDTLNSNQDQPWRWRWLDDKEEEEDKKGWKGKASNANSRCQDDE